MKKLFPLLSLILFSGCKKNHYSQIKNSVESEILNFGNSSDEVSSTINVTKNTVKERFSAPEGFSWEDFKLGTFENFIETFRLKDYGSPILKYNGTAIATQNLHEAVFDIDTGTQDLQQCADSVIRLYAEYLYKNKKFDEIKFHFTSGDLATWNDYKNGIRPVINGNSVHFVTSEKYDDSYKNFRNYLNLVFNYSGTISLNRETKPVSKNSELKTGDILITPGSPGHVVFIAGTCKNSEGKKLYLLAEGYTPAQSIHVLKNPFNTKISPWYDLDVNAVETKTARYLFKPTNFRSF